MTKKILITGGAVHCYLDDVKIITNRFKGGLMVKLVDDFVIMAEDGKIDVHITYLCSKNSKQPPTNNKFRTVLYHDGINDYMRIVLELAPTMDAVVLGAAVANLIPKNKIKGKFDSHNYKEGDIIPIDFTIAPRIIDRVKKVAPNTLLFGFKLLSGVNYYELVRAAYGVLLESKAVTVFANDSMDLMLKYVVTKERGVHPIHNDQVVEWIMDRLGEKYYSTLTAKTDQIPEDMKKGQEYLNQLLIHNKNSFIETDEGYWFGSGAVLTDWPKIRFVTTARGKNELEDFAFVGDVDHNTREVFCETTKKASLNAPLFHWIFSSCSQVKYILHFHHQREDLITLDYATPGTDMDTVRLGAGDHPSFNIKGHGCILSYSKIGELLK